MYPLSNIIYYVLFYIVQLLDLSDDYNVFSNNVYT